MCDGFKGRTVLGPRGVGQFDGADRGYPDQGKATAGAGLARPTIRIRPASVPPSTTVVDHRSNAGATRSWNAAPRVVAISLLIPDAPPMQTSPDDKGQFRGRLGLLKRMSGMLPPCTPPYFSPKGRIASSDIPQSSCSPVNARGFAGSGITWCKG
jgi:hypothetical protein